MAPKILLAEDDFDLSRLICNCLGERFELVCAENAAIVFEQFKKKERPDVVLLNYRLPDAAGSSPADVGLTLLRFIKQVSPKTAVVMFSGSISLEVAFEAGRLGAFAFVTKPCVIEKLIEVLDGAIEYRKALLQNTKPSFRISENDSLTYMQQIERDTIAQTLKEAGGNILETAKRLGIGRQTLYNKIKAYGIEV